MDEHYIKKNSNKYKLNIKMKQTSDVSLEDKQKKKWNEMKIEHESWLGFFVCVC